MFKSMKYSFLADVSWGVTRMCTAGFLWVIMIARLWSILKGNLLKPIAQCYLKSPGHTGILR